MNSFWRMVATGVMWLAMTIVMAVLFTQASSFNSGLSGFTVTVVALALIAGAVLGTIAVWYHSGEAPTEAVSHAQAAKAKRLQERRVERLLEALEDDEVYELEALLLARDNGGVQHAPRS